MPPLQVPQTWCNSDIAHLDLSYWAFEILAHPVYGVMPLEFQPVDCTSNTPLTPFTPGFVNKTVYSDLVSALHSTHAVFPSATVAPSALAVEAPQPGHLDMQPAPGSCLALHSFREVLVSEHSMLSLVQVQPGWSWQPYYLHSSQFALAGAGVDGSAATCINLATRAAYNASGPGGGGLGLTCRNCTDSVYTALPAPFSGALSTADQPSVVASDAFRAIYAPDPAAILTACSCVERPSAALAHPLGQPPLSKEATPVLLKPNRRCTAAHVKPPVAIVNSLACLSWPMQCHADSSMQGHHLLSLLK